MNVETKEVVAVELTTDDVHDSKVFSRLLKKAERRRKVSKVYGDGAYDSSEVYEVLKSKGIDAIIKPRKNSRLDTPSKATRKAVKQYKRLGHRNWIKLREYGRRWSVETAYSTYKRAFGESTMAKTIKHITEELTTKALIYNMLLTL